MIGGVGSWLYHYLGINGSGSWYGWWSGAGSDIGELVLFGGIYGFYRAHNCHVKGCWRLKRHPVDGTPFVVCGKHHPNVPSKITADHVASVLQDNSLGRRNDGTSPSASGPEQGAGS